MSSSTTRSLFVASRTTARRSTGHAKPRFVSTQPSTVPHPITSTPPPPPPNSHFSHALAGIGGGAVVLGGIYAYYHYSGTAKVVATSKSAISSAQSLTSSIASATPSPSDALSLLRSLAKSYAAAIPGAALAIDSSFDQLEKAAEKHGDKVVEITKKVYADLVEAVKDGEKGGDKVVGILVEAAKKVQELVGEEGGKVADWVGDNLMSPELKKALGGKGEEFQKLAEKHGPEAQRIATSFYSSAYTLVQKGGLNSKTIEQAQKLLSEKTKELTELTKNATSDAWALSAESVKPLLEKMPDVGKLVDENVGSLKGYVGEERVKAVKDLYSELEKIGKSGKSPDEMAKAARKVVESRVGSLNELKKKAEQTGGDLKKKAGDVAGDVVGGASASGGETLSKLAKSVPGLAGIEKIFSDTDFKQLKDLAEKKGEKVEKLLEEAYDDIKKVLQKKVEEAKKVADETKGEAKKATSS